MAVIPALDLDTLTAWLAAARLAYHNVMLGTGVAEVQVDGYLTKFTRMNAGDLLAYIARLEGQIAAFGTPCAPIGAIGVVF